MAQGAASGTAVSETSAAEAAPAERAGSGTALINAAPAFEPASSQGAEPEAAAASSAQVCTQENFLVGLFQVIYKPISAPAFFACIYLRSPFSLK